MKNLITNEQVISLAFGDGEYLSPEVILDSDIALAEDRYIVPVVGAELHQALLDGSYPTLLDDFVAPALAMAVRTVVQPAPASSGSAKATIEPSEKPRIGICRIRPKERCDAKRLDQWRLYTDALMVPFSV